MLDGAACWLCGGTLLRVSRGWLGSKDRPSVAVECEGCHAMFLSVTPHVIRKINEQFKAHSDKVVATEEVYKL